MEGGSGGGLEYDAKEPLLVMSNEQEQDMINNGNGRGDIWCHRHRYSFTSLKNDFFSKLPLKVQHAMDPDSPFDLDLSNTSGLIEGTLIIFLT